MSLEEIAVIALCLFGGYWGVSFLFHRKERERGPQRDTLLTQDPQSAPGWATVLGVSPISTEWRSASRARCRHSATSMTAAPAYISPTTERNGTHPRLR